MHKGPLSNSNTNAGFCKFQKHRLANRFIIFQVVLLFLKTISFQTDLFELFLLFRRA